MKSIISKLREAMARVLLGSGLIGALFLALMLGVIGFVGSEDYLE